MIEKITSFIKKLTKATANDESVKNEAPEVSSKEEVKANRSEELPIYLKEAIDVLAKYNIDATTLPEYKMFYGVRRKIQTIIESLGDEDSKKQYIRELGRLVITKALGPQESAKLHGNMSFEQYEEYVALAEASTVKQMKYVVKNEIVEKIPVGPFIIEEYRYKDIFKVEQNDIVIDGGAFCGETALWFLMNGAKKVYSFEPIQRQLDLIVENLPEEVEAGRIVPELYGLSNKDEILSFSDAGAGSRVSQKGTIQINCTTIDSYCEKNSVAPTLIKLDIEGAEVPALEGAAETIKKYKPKLAVCLYHRPQDMYLVPSILKTFVPEYTFYCKANHPFYEFVLYAVPSK